MSNTTTQYTPGQRIRYTCDACGKQTTGTVEGVQHFPQADLVLATCDNCGSTRTVDRIPVSKKEISHV